MSGGPRWVPGSVYRVRSVTTGDEPLESRGTFEGFLPLSDSHALAITLDGSHDDEGTRRLIPVGKVLAVDVVEQADEEPEDTDQLYYS